MNSLYILFMLINFSRVVEGNVLPLNNTMDLNIRATARAEYLVDNNQWSHDNWQSSFYGSGCLYGGENLARNFTQSIDAHIALMNSVTHKENILMPRFNYVGVGNYKNVTVELFCEK